MNKQRLLKILGFFIQNLLFLFILIMVNYISSKNYSRWDLTSHKIHSLGPEIKSYLKQLDEDFIIHVFMPERISDPISNKLYKEELRELINQLQNFNHFVKVDYINVEKEIGRAKKLLEKYEINKRDTIAVEYKGRKTLLGIGEMVVLETLDNQSCQVRIKEFKGEEVFTNAIHRLLSKKQTNLCLTEGHGEPSIKDPSSDGFGILSELMKKENIKVQKFFPLEKGNPECDILAILGPEKEFLSSEIDKFIEMLNNGTKLLLLLDPLLKEELSGFKNLKLEGLLNYFGLNETRCIAIDPESPIPMEGAETIYVTQYLSHSITSTLVQFPMFFQMAQAFEEMDNDPEGLDSNELLETTESGWCEKDLVDPEQIKNDPKVDIQGPLTLAYASEIKKSKAVIVGNSLFATNSLINKGANRSFLINSLRWLSEKQVKSSPKAKTFVKKGLEISSSQLKYFNVVSTFVTGPLFLVFGAFLFFRRRRGLKIPEFEGSADEKK